MTTNRVPHTTSACPRSRLHFATLALAVVLATAAVRAGNVVINCEDLTNRTLVQHQYDSKGVYFVNDGPNPLPAIEEQSGKALRTDGASPRPMKAGFQTWRHNLDGVFQTRAHKHIRFLG